MVSESAVGNGTEPALSVTNIDRRRWPGFRARYESLFSHGLAEVRTEATSLPKRWLHVDESQWRQRVL
jgi:hypothetical protein